MMRHVRIIATLLGCSVLACMPMIGDKGSVRKLSSDGVAGFAYQAGSIRWSSDGKSLMAYRVSDEVWLSDSLVVGSVKDLIVKGAWQVLQP